MSDSIGLLISGIFFVVVGAVLGWWVVSVMGVVLVATSVMK